MKAIRVHNFGGSDSLKLEEIVEPAPGPDDVVIDIKAVGVNPIDTYIRSGVHAIVPDLPYTPGSDAAGVIAAVGTNVSDYKIGDRVFTGAALGLNMEGCYAEKIVRPSADTRPLPGNVSFAQGAALGIPYATAHYALFSRGNAKTGETVFIHGASGAVGTAAIQLAKRAGLTVIGSAGSDAGLQLVQGLGADHVVNHSTQGYLDELKTLTEDNGPQLILEMLANVNLADDLELVAKYGRIVVIGSRGEVTINPRVAMMKEVDIRALAIFNGSREQMEKIVTDLHAGLEDGSICPVIGRERPLVEASESHDAVLNASAFGKIILVP